MVHVCNWVAVYPDSEFKQYNADGSENKYKDINRDRLIYFDLYMNGSRLLRYHFDTPDKKLIYRRRVFKLPGGIDRVYYLVGWQIHIETQTGERNIQSLAIVDETTGQIEIYDRWKKDVIYEEPEINRHEGEDWDFTPEEFNGVTQVR